MDILWGCISRGAPPCLGLSFIPTSSIGRAACLRFRAWVLVPLPGAAAVCAWEVGTGAAAGCRCRVPLLLRALVYGILYVFLGSM